MFWIKTVNACLTRMLRGQPLSWGTCAVKQVNGPRAHKIESKSTERLPDTATIPYRMNRDVHGDDVYAEKPLKGTGLQHKPPSPEVGVQSETAIHLAAVDERPHLWDPHQVPAPETTTYPKTSGPEGPILPLNWQLYLSLRYTDKQGYWNLYDFLSWQC